ncbi:MAG: 6-hydroxymethylpterin diphosphokinase MptE-like protein [Phycisphaerales bacterium]
MNEANPFDFSQSAFGSGGMPEASLGGLLGGESGIPADTSILEQNLIALCARNAELAQRIASAAPRAGSVFEKSADGGITGTLDGRRMGSKRRVLDEARALAEGVDPESCAAACVVGFGLGHHICSLQEHLGMKSVVIVYEPDVSLLRSVFERVDHSGWLALGRCIIVTEANDAAGLSRRIEGLEGIVSLGAQIIEHAPSKSRIDDTAGMFGSTVSSVVRATRTNIVTTLVHAPITLRNMLMNADRYATSGGITKLKGCLAGYPAVTVAAGPSLQRNLALLGEDGVRDRVVIIAAQTVLKPMLAAGIKPHFVTALDHHELSGRFYEGLTSEDVEGVRLVVEPKANPAIFEKFPGEILCTQEEVLDSLIGDELTREIGELPAGATVAHLSYFLARYLGCDPVIMIGQDLAFTDGQYYSANAAIHTVWQGELNPDRSLEMLEWERVARMRANLHRVAGQNGHALYADEQMVTYLAQFETEFQRDAMAGLTTIDATEGGASKQHTIEMTLRYALDVHAKRDYPRLPDTSLITRPMESVRGQLRRHWEKLIEQTEQIKKASTQTGEKLREIAAGRVDIHQANEIVSAVQATGERVQAIQPCFQLVEFINQSGVLNRFKADRMIGLREGGDAIERQRKQAERDVTNVEWIGHAADELQRQVRFAIDVLDGKREKITRDQVEAESIAIGHESVRSEIFVLCDPYVSGTGFKRDIGEPVWQGQDALALTLRRALRCQTVRGVRVLTPDADRVGALIERVGFTGKVAVEQVDADRWSARAQSIGIARANAGSCWRGGLGQTTIFDELLDPKTIQDVMQKAELDAVAVIGADWALIDPVLIDEVVQRHAESPDRHAITFTQAVPGLSACVLGREAISSLVELQSAGSPLGTIGGLLGYVPVNTQADPIGTTLCVSVDPIVRDAGIRVVADSAFGRRMISAAMDRLGDRADSSSVVQSTRAVLASMPEAPAQSLVLDLCSDRTAGGVFGAWKRGEAEPAHRTPMAAQLAMDLLHEHAASRSDATVTFDGPGDPLMHHQALDLAAFSKGLGISCVSLRTDLLSSGQSDDEIIASGIGVLSVDLLASDEATYAALTGVDAYQGVFERVGALADARGLDAGGLRSPWVVPRITKCDAVLGQVEGFYDAWIMTVGAAVIDPQPGWVSDRVRPLPVPNRHAELRERNTLRVRCDGALCDAWWRPVGAVNVIQDGLSGATAAWRAHIAHGMHSPKPASMLTGALQ